MVLLTVLKAHIKCNQIVDRAYTLTSIMKSTAKCIANSICMKWKKVHSRLSLCPLLDSSLHGHHGSIPLSTRTRDKAETFEFSGVTLR